MRTEIITDFSNLKEKGFTNFESLMLLLIEQISELNRLIQQK